MEDQINLDCHSRSRLHLFMWSNQMWPGIVVSLTPCIVYIESDLLPHMHDWLKHPSPDLILLFFFFIILRNSWYSYVWVVDNITKNLLYEPFVSFVINNSKVCRTTFSGYCSWLFLMWRSSCCLWSDIAIVLMNNSVIKWWRISQHHGTKNGWAGNTKWSFQ